MAARLEITLKPELFDAEGESILRKASDYFNFSLQKVRVIHVLTIDARLGKDELEAIRREIFTNPVTQLSSYEPVARDFDWIIWVGFRPGVRDTAGSVAMEAITDYLDYSFSDDEAVYTSKIYQINAPELTREDVEQIAKELLANDTIQQWKIFPRAKWDEKNGIGIIIPRVILNREPTVTVFPLESDEELARLSAERNLALHPNDIPVIRKYFLDPEVRESRKKVGLFYPTDVELEYISQARSDHCNHNTFRGKFHYSDLSTGEKVVVDNLFKTCIEKPTLELQKKKDWVISVLWDNAGVAKFDDENNYVITGETHNSPSNIEAYGGALTGIVGVYRDPMGTGKGAKLIAGMYGYCVGPRDYDADLKPRLHPRRLLDGIIEGVRDGGNKSGIPTPFGNLLFHPSYLGKCLVYVTAVGIMPATIHGKPSHEKTTSDGDLIVMCGGRVGKDGIHGVTASSEIYSEHTPAGHVQIGDPYTQKKMHDFLLEARDEGLIEFITDNGGGGLSSSVGESARFSGGAYVELDRVPLKYEGLDQWEIWVSESQERMTVAVKPENWERFETLSKKHAVESTVIGKYTSNGKLHITYEGKTCAYIDIDFLQAGFPQWEFEAEWKSPEQRGLSEPVLSTPSDYRKLFHEFLSSPNICSREWITRQYDHEVQGTSVIKHLGGRRRDVPNDAAVLCPILGSTRGLALTQAINPTYSAIDTYWMIAATIDEAVRRLIAVGAQFDKIGGVDNFCWPNIQYDPINNPDGKYKAAQLVRANWALRDICEAYEIPLLSGKDSMYIDGNLPGRYGEKHKVSGLPAMQFTASGIVKDVRLCQTMDFKKEGEAIYVLGNTGDELGGSEYYCFLGYTGLNVPKLDPQQTIPLYRALQAAMEEKLVTSCKSINRGGLGVSIALAAFAGEVGAELDLGRVPTNESLTSEKILFSESCGRFIVTVSRDKRGEFESLMADLPVSLVGQTLKSRPVLRILDKTGKLILNEPLENLKHSWKKPFARLG